MEFSQKQNNKAENKKKKKESKARVFAKTRCEAEKRNKVKKSYHVLLL